MQTVLDELDSEEALNNEKDIVKGVINRLIRKDGVLIVLDEGQGDDADTQMERILAVHPNYVPDS